MGYNIKYAQGGFFLRKKKMKASSNIHVTFTFKGFYVYMEKTNLQPHFFCLQFLVCLIQFGLQVNTFASELRQLHMTAVVFVV